MASPKGSREDDEREELDKEHKTLLDRIKAVFWRSAKDDKKLIIQNMRQELNKMERMKRTLEDLRNENICLKAKLQEDYLHTTVHSKTLEKKVAQLEDEIRALREISKETQERQLSNIQSTSSAMQQQQRCAGTADELTFITAELGRVLAVVKVDSQSTGNLKRLGSCP